MSSAVPRPTHWLCALACVACLLGAASTSYAKPRPTGSSKADPDLERAKKLFYQGQKLFDLRRFEQALEKYEAAFEAKAIPDFLFNIGQCHRNLDNFDEAIFSFRRFLQLEPETPRREQIEALIAELEQRKQQAAEDARAVPLIPPDDRGARRPVWKKWWFWTGMAAVAAGTTAILLTTTGSGLPGTDLGNVDFGK
ncbi:MAG TPA: tetratricopeptide repeat protein [Kofleriaceae bacterium]|nr:tetratricopeptide repeat protein [Kofleriaceae bacterium]